MAVLDRDPVGEAAERLEDVRVGLVAAEAEPRGDVQLSAQSNCSTSRSGRMPP